MHRFFAAIKCLFYSVTPFSSQFSILGWVLRESNYILRTFNITHLTVIWLAPYILIQFVGNKTKTTVLECGEDFIRVPLHPIPTSGNSHPLVSTFPPTFLRPYVALIPAWKSQPLWSAKANGAEEFLKEQAPRQWKLLEKIISLEGPSRVFRCVWEKKFIIVTVGYMCGYCTS